MAAIGRKLSTTGSTLRSTLRDEPIASPSGMAKRRGTTKPAKTRPRLCSERARQIARSDQIDGRRRRTRVGTGVRGLPVAVPMPAIRRAA